MVYESRAQLWKLCVFQWRFLLRQPMNVLALLVLAVAALAIHFVDTLDGASRWVISSVCQASVLGLGAMVMADLLGGNQQLLALLKERGVAFRTWPALTFAHGGLGFVLCLPAILVSTSREGASIIDTLLLVFIVLVSSMTLASVSYALVHVSARQKFLAAVLWAAPVLAFLFFAVFGAVGAVLLFQFDEVRVLERMLAAYTGGLACVLNPLVGWYLRRCPRKLHG